ncbi:LysR family transcriptional regulator [Xenorhabdus anantnagensis]|uniref:LysR family transcriptional regulator n=1 Tax=Xenorhabdus anantnagensis TaxID=3025875 RepID=A0ABT5LSV3_9GAMM|nr:LysR family transcriptional regulator [Xenorhabdus anantnagensis]MDC9596105.1 LysR family transcriptional regulator [Xenorhabdus anantnagensis]
MSITKYEIFETVIMTGSFSKAAEKLNKTQSAISHAVSALEKELGVFLFVRNGRKVSLTHHGINAYAYICRILEINRNLMKKKFIDENIPYVLRIGVFESVKRTILPSVIKEINKSYPFIDIILFEGGYDEIKEWIINDLIDFGFTISDDFGCESIPILEDELVMATKIDMESPLDGVSLNGFFNINKFIMPMAPYKNKIEIFFNENNISPNVYSHVSDCNTIAKMVDLGIGVSIGPKLFLQSFEKIKLHDLPIKLHRSIYLSHKKHYFDRVDHFFIGEVKKAARGLI